MGASDVVYVEKRRGPRTDPWGTPVTNLCALDTFPPQATLKDRPVRYDSNQQSGIPVMSSDERVDRRIWWLTVSKAADRSSRMRTDDLESAFWCCVVQTCKIEQAFAMCSLKVSWSSKITPRFLTEADGEIVDEPNWIVKSCCRVGVAGKTRSSVFARLSCRWCSFIHAEMSARQPEIHAATVGSSGRNER